MRKPVINIGVCLTLPGLICNRALAGFYRFARSCPSWRISQIQVADGVGARSDAFGGLRLDAIFTDSTDVVDASQRGAARADCPKYVLLEGIRPGYPNRNGAVLGVDNRQIGAAAAKRLRTLGYRNLAFVGPIRSILSTSAAGQERMWRLTRLLMGAFERRARELGCRVLAPLLPKPDRTNSDVGQLEDWLRALPLPCGLLAYSDEDAVDVLTACRGLAIGVPTKIGILGVDNEEYLCESTSPAISSLAPDYEGAGYRAAELISRLLGGKKSVAGTRNEYGLAGFAERESARSVNTANLRTDKVLAIIRQDPARAPAPRALAERFGLSLRVLELAFKESVGHSVTKEIVRQRLNQAKHLLKTTRLPIGEIATQSGFGSYPALHAAFRRAYGQSPSSLRK